MLTELTLRCGNITSTGFDARLQHWLAASYANLCTTYHHVELDALNTSLTTDSTVNTVALPADTFVLISVKLYRSTIVDTPVNTLTLVDFRSLIDDYTGASALPTKAARYGNTLYFDSKPDDTYRLYVYYYKYGTAPDFTTPTSHELGLDVDEHIYEGALRYVMPNLARPDLGAVQRQLLSDWLNEQVRVTTSDQLTALPERERTTTTFTKGQG